MIKSKTSILLIFILSFSLVITRNSYGQYIGKKTVLWEISGNGLEKNSYLYGTIHIIPKKEFQVHKKADNILKASDQLILEMLIDVPLKQQLEWARKMLLPDGNTIKDFSSPEDYQRISSYALDSLKIKKFMFDSYIKFKPFAFYSALIPAVIGKKTKSYELHFSKISKKKKIPVAELESFDIQMAIFDSIPNEVQMKMFFPEEMNLYNEMAEINELYNSQDIYKLASLIKEGEENEYSNFENELLIQRNLNWVEKLDTLMAEKSSFIAVGAGHLAGEYGLIKLLRNKGYVVEAICLNKECE